VDVRQHKPLLGFGPVGWASLAVLTAFLIALARGWDPVYTVARIIWHFSDDQIGNWVRIWAKVWLYPAQMMLGVTFGIWGLLYASVAFFIHPRRLPLTPIVLLFATVGVEAFAYGFTTPAFQARFPIHLMTILRLAAAATELGLILWITRRWWCAAPLIIPLMWNAVVPDLARAPWAWPYLDSVRIAAHVAIAIPLLVWAVSARLRPAPSTRPCPACDYDLTGLNDSARCPECGRTAASSA